MAKRKYNKSTGRDYTYDTKYESSEKQKKARANRGKARYAFEKAGKVKKHDGKDIDHKDGNPFNNKKSNLHVMSKSRNRAKH